MQLQLARTEHGLIPVNDADVEAIKNLSLGTHIVVEYKPRRNVKFHRKYFALLNAVLPNQKHFKTVDNLNEAVKYRAGHFETIFTLGGQEIIKTKSIAFHTMDEEAFGAFYKHALDVCVELVGEDAINDILRFI